MDAKQTVEDSVAIVQGMALAPQEALAVLDPEEQEKLVAQLPSLAKQAGEVRRSGVGLLILAEAIHRLVEGIPALTALFPPTHAGVRRSATEEDLNIVFSGEQAQKQADQIYNAIVKLSQGIKLRLQDSVVMVQQMSVVPEEVLVALDRAGREKLVAELPLLIEQADEVQRTGVGSLDLAEAIHRLVEGIPALAALFPPTQAGIRRSGTDEDLEAMYFGKQAQEQAAQIDNSLHELQRGINQEIQKLQQRSDGDQGQTNPSS